MKFPTFEELAGYAIFGTLFAMVGFPFWIAVQFLSLAK